MRLLGNVVSNRRCINHLLYDYCEDFWNYTETVEFISILSISYMSIDETSRLVFAQISRITRNWMICLQQRRSSALAVVHL